MLRAAAEHQGTALVEIYQNCNIFNDGAFDVLKDNDTRDDWIIPLEHGQPLRFGARRQRAVVRDEFGGLQIAYDVAADDPRVVVHDAHRDDPAYAFALSRLSGERHQLRADGRVPLRRARRPTTPLMADQLATARRESHPVTTTRLRRPAAGSGHLVGGHRAGR